jgi:hypothetical protein
VKIAMLGAGQVGRTLGSALIALGHEVVMGSRTGENPEAEAWAAESGGSTGTFAEAAAWGEVVFNVTAGQHSLSALTLAGAENLAGKVVVDVSNPLDFSRGFPPRLTHVNDTSVAEELQAAFPSAHIVKALNMVANPIMVNPRLLPEPTDMLICGDDGEAKATVTALLQAFGWERIVDLGGIKHARGLEAWLLLWTRLYGALGTPMFNVKLVKGA